MVFKKSGLFLMVAITVSTGFCADADELPASSHIKLGFGAQGTISIPVTMIPAEEAPHYQSLLKEKTKAQVAELVGLVKRSLPEEPTSSTDFLKRMALANQLTLQFSTEAKELFSLTPTK